MLKNVGVLHSQITTNICERDKLIVTTAFLVSGAFAGSLYNGQLSNSEALTGKSPAILDCFDCEQTLYQLSNIIQGMSTPVSNPEVISFRLQCKLMTVIQAADQTVVGWSSLL